MAELLIITGEGASIGFRCAGLDTKELGEGEDISSVIAALQNERRYGLIAVEEKLLEQVSENVMKRIRRKGLPIVIPINIPHSWGEVEFGESPVVRLIRRAIGYQIKLKK